MKKYLLILSLALITAFSSLFFAAYAQEYISGVEDSFKKEREDFLLQFNNYNNAYEQYDRAKKAYQKFGTITSQQGAIASTKQVLIYRAEALRSYLQLIKVVLNSQNALDIFLRNSQFGKIEATQSFLETHKQNAARAQSITEVNSTSERLESQAESIDDLSYETLSVILIGRMQQLEKREQMMIEEIERKGDLPEDIQLGISETKKKLIEIRSLIDETIQMIHQYQESKNIKSRVIRKKASSVYREIKKDSIVIKEKLSEVAILIKEMKGKLGDE